MARDHAGFSAGQEKNPLKKSYLDWNSIRLEKTMAEAKIVTQKQQDEEPSNIFSLLPKFELKFPFFNREKNVSPAQEPHTPLLNEGETDKANQKPNFVSFPNTHQIISPPLDVEFQESSGKTHNPIVIWQVYAVGGFIIVKWVWARWKERKERAKKSGEDDNQSSDEYQSPVDEND